MGMNIPLNAEVHCQDGICGESNGVIINPRSQQVTHFVVKKRRSAHVSKLVPGTLVNGTTVNTIELCLCSDELADMENFEEIRFEPVDEVVSKIDPLQIEAEGFSLWPQRGCEDQIVSLKRERGPAGELAIRKGVKVFATDGLAGKVNEFMIDSDNGRITHLIMRKGLLWNQKEVIIPISHVARIDPKCINLKLDKRGIRTLPATLLRQVF